MRIGTGRTGARATDGRSDRRGENPAPRRPEPVGRRPAGLRYHEEQRATKARPHRPDRPRSETTRPFRHETSRRISTPTRSSRHGYPPSLLGTHTTILGSPGSRIGRRKLARHAVECITQILAQSRQGGNGHDSNQRCDQPIFQHSYAPTIAFQGHNFPQEPHDIRPLQIFLRAHNPLDRLNTDCIHDTGAPKRAGFSIVFQVNINILATKTGPVHTGPVENHMIVSCRLRHLGSVLKRAGSHCQALCFLHFPHRHDPVAPRRHWR